MPHFIYESRLLKTMTGPICGVDEAGRGPLAGPVVAAAVILDRARFPKGLNDSKQLDEETREELFPLILDMAVAVGVGEAKHMFTIPSATSSEVREKLFSVLLLQALLLFC